MREIVIIRLLIYSNLPGCIRNTTATQCKKNNGFKFKKPHSVGLAGTRLSRV